MAQLEEAREKVDELDYLNGQLRTKNLDLEDRLDSANGQDAKVAEESVQELREQLEEANHLIARLQEDSERSPSRNQREDSSRLEDITDSIERLLQDGPESGGEIDASAALQYLASSSEGIADLPGDLMPHAQKLYALIKKCLGSINSLNAKLTEASQEVVQRTEEFDALHEEYNEQAQVHASELAQLANEWRDELELERSRADELAENVSLQCFDTAGD